MKRSNKKLSWLSRAIFAIASKVISGADFDFFFKGMGQTDNLFIDMTKANMEKAYELHQLVFRCVRLIASSFLEANTIVGKDTPDGFVEAENHPVLQLIRNPNPELSFPELIDYHMSHWQMTGRSFIWKWRNAGGRVIELWPIPSSWVVPIGLGKVTAGDRRRFISHYELTIPGQSMVQILATDMCYSKFGTARDFINGVSPFGTTQREYQIDRDRQDYQKEMLENTVQPGLVLSQPGQYDIDQKDAIRAALVDKVGKKKRGSPLLLSGEGAKADMMTPLADFDWKGLTNLSESRMCLAMGTPAILVGARVGLENSPWSNTKEAKKIFFETTMIPLWILNSAIWTRCLLHQEGDKENIIWHDFQEVQVFKKDQTEVATQAKILVDSGIATRNQGRAMVGLEPDEKRGNVYLQKINVVEVPAETAPEEAMVPARSLSHEVNWNGESIGGQGKGNGGGKGDGATKHKRLSKVSGIGTKAKG